MRYADFKIVEQKIVENASGWHRVSVGNTVYEVGNDLIRQGNSYAIFSGNSARQYADANGYIIPPIEVIQSVYSQARKLVMPARNNNPTDTNAEAHTQDIFEANNLNGFPTGLVCGHKKEVVAPSASNPGRTRIYGGWNGSSAIQPDSSIHGGGYVDYSQGMRACRVAEGEAPTTTASTRGQTSDDSAGAQETETVDGLQAGPPYPAEARQEVAQMQTKLQRIGYNVGETGIDGKYGPRTTRAVTAYKTDFNVDGDGRSMTDEQLTALQSAQAIAEPTPTGNENSSPGSGPATGGQPGSLEGTAVLAANPNERQLPNQNIIDALDRAASALGIQVQITTNGGRASRDGTNNHPPGQAADIQIVRNGNIVTPDQAASAYDELIQTLVTNAAQRGVRPGIGGYPWGIHYDESNWRQGRDSIAGTWNRGFDIMTGVNAAQQGLA